MPCTTAVRMHYNWPRLLQFLHNHGKRPVSRVSAQYAQNRGGVVEHLWALTWNTTVVYCGHGLCTLQSTWQVLLVTCPLSIRPWCNVEQKPTSCCSNFSLPVKVALSSSWSNTDRKVYLVAKQCSTHVNIWGISNESGANVIPSTKYISALCIRLPYDPLQEY